MKKIFSIILFTGIASLVFVACQKNNLVIDKDVVPPSYAKFNTIAAGDTIGRYLLRSVGNTFKLPIGVTTVSDHPRTINLSYSSNTAAQGQQYEAPTSITIPAGQAVDTLTIKGLLAGYASSSRVDTLKITITEGDGVKASPYKQNYYVIMRKYCDVDLNAFLGDYNNTNEDWGGSKYGPYTTSISSVTPISATKGRIVVENIFDWGWGPITFELDWFDPANFKVTVVPQTSGIADAGKLSSAYAGGQVAVRPMSGVSGTFNSCDQVITLKMQLGVAGVGYFSDLYTVVMAR
ncbi:MAG: hypothetical protein ACO1OO_17395 [Flavisolibacter sp.]